MIMIENPLHIFYRRIEMTLPRIKPRKNLEFLLVQCTYLCDPVCMHVLRSLFFATINMKGLNPSGSLLVALPEL